MDKNLLIISKFIISKVKRLSTYDVLWVLQKVGRNASLNCLYYSLMFLYEGLIKNFPGGCFDSKGIARQHSNTYIMAIFTALFSVYNNNFWLAEVIRGRKKKNPVWGAIIAVWLSFHSYLWRYKTRWIDRDEQTPEGEWALSSLLGVRWLINCALASWVEQQISQCEGVCFGLWGYEEAQSHRLYKVCWFSLTVSFNNHQEIQWGRRGIKRERRTESWKESGEQKAGKVSLAETGKPRNSMKWW